MANTVEAEVTHVRQGGVLVITLHRPDKLNALTPTMSDLYTETLRMGAEDPAVRAIVVTGAGRAFCAGADVGRLQALHGGGARVAPLRRPWFPLTLPKPVIAVINGVCLGAGTVLAMMCDMRIGGESARMGPGFTTLGLPAENGIAWPLLQSLGYARAFEFLARGQTLTAPALERLGLLNEVVPDAQLLAHAIGIAEQIASTCSPESLAMMKRQLLHAVLASLQESDALADELINAALKGADFKEAMAARREGRSPRFAGVGKAALDGAKS
ncbi:enoyl-CoA hydratase-related protein [Hydrogenophaga sp.]|uniref:enoyl-CoA hydratase-related protein n=1 Tax=Hydrogenophaga sp. TaxID=1904254 RepID=UPI002717A35F|nr:enoyl-CoA hydratase-related protein [Hydrogenophaga sp.]MDO9437607.1 enoyl-CoA hydratase-related protein [Hydrogenophaga sp.]